MKKISKFIANHSLLIVIIGLIMLVPAFFGYINTKVNYDILVYLPKNVDTIKGQDILKDEFHLGSFAIVMVPDKNPVDTLKLEKKIKKIDTVENVISIEDVKDVSIPKDMLPDIVQNKIYNGDETLIMVTFSGGTSEDSTLEAITKLRKVVKNENNVQSMSGMVVDTKAISDREVAIYVIIAVILCLVVLTISTDSYVIPFLLLGNIGMAIIYNMGTNIIFGEISYITQAISAILQLGVTTDFSIFLYHQYEEMKKNRKKYPTNKDAMASAITATFTSILGSSLTTFAGFLALCTMSLTLGRDIGLVMAKGVLWGLISVLTLFPGFLLAFDKIIDKTHHKVIMPEFKFLQKFSLNKRALILVIFAILLIPAVYGNSHYKVYYKLDESLPKTLPSRMATEKLKNNYGIVSPNMILLDKNLPKDEVQSLIKDLKKEKGIDLVISPTSELSDDMIEMLPDKYQKMMESDNYQMIIYNSKYEIASDKLNKEVEDVQNLVKKYDKKGLVAGEGALMKDLVKIADHDFNAVNYTSMIVIFIIMIIVLKSLGLPIILIITIEFAIMLNLSCAWLTNTRLPFVASIVVGTIQLGATIDYAILMSTTYLHHREKYDKKESMRKTLEFVTPSIITSALCFFAATFGVGVYTKIDMIGSICNLLARGSIISMLTVLLLLPSLLTLCDGFIMKTTKTKGAK